MANFRESKRAHATKPRPSTAQLGRMSPKEMCEMWDKYERKYGYKKRYAENGIDEDTLKAYRAALKKEGKLQHG